MQIDLSKILTADAFAGYVDAVKPEFVERTELKSIFPETKIFGLDFSYIKTSNGVIELTPISAFDAEPIAQQRAGFDAMSGELPLFRKKMTLSEKEKQRLVTQLLLSGGRAGDAGVQTILTNIYDDQYTLVEGARMTMEFLRSRVLMDGKISIKSATGALTFDYKVPSNHKVALSSGQTWDKPNASIVTQVRKWIDTINKDTGRTPDTIVLNRNTMALLRANQEIRANIVPLSVMANATITNQTYITDEAIINAFKSLTGITNVMVYDGKVKMDGKVLDLIEDKKVALFPSTVRMGKTLIGVSPAEFNAQNLANAGNEVSITEEGIAVNAYITTQAPYIPTTEVEFISIPSFEGSDFVFQATVQE